MSQNSSNSSQNHFQQNEQEISLLDILRFLKGAWKITTVTGALGFMVSSLYILIIPAQYEAVTRITMAKVPIQSNHVIGISIEDPAALISRANLSNLLLNSDVITSCGFGGATEIRPNLDKYIHMSVIKQHTSTVEIKVRRPTQDLAKYCASRVSHLIVADQKNMLDTLVEFSEAHKKSRLIVIEQRLRQNQALVAKLGQSDTSPTQVFMSMLLETRQLEDERQWIIAESIRDKRLQADPVQSSIEVSENLVDSIVRRSLLIGLFGGIFLGLLIALFRRDIKKLKSTADGFL